AFAGCSQAVNGPGLAAGTGAGAGAGDGAGGACSAPRARCGDACVDVGSDPSNCGGCGVACAAGATCVEAQCIATCAVGQTRCATGCVDVSSDVANCGGCG